VKLSCLQKGFPGATNGLIFASKAEAHASRKQYNLLKLLLLNYTLPGRTPTASPESVPPTATAAKTSLSGRRGRPGPSPKGSP